MQVRALIVIYFLLVCGMGAIAAESSPASKSEAEPIVVVIETTMGAFTIEMYPGKAPETVKNFAAYVIDGYYENTLFHRVVPEFVIQAGGFEPGMIMKAPRGTVVNESLNGLKNTRGSVAMARKRMPHSATSQFYVNLVDNDVLDPRGSQFGYTVFGQVTEGMDVIDAIAGVPTGTVRQFNDVPNDDVRILSAKFKGGTPDIQLKSTTEQAKSVTKKTFVAGQDYVLLDKPVATTSKKKVEVVEVFSYGCPHCYSFEGRVKQWQKQLVDDVEFRQQPAIWNGLMRIFAHAFYTLHDQETADQLHDSLFAAVVIDGRPLLSESMMGAFFEEQGIDNETFGTAFDSASVVEQVALAEAYTRDVKIADIPAIIVNGKYRVSVETAGGHAEMLEVVDYLIEKELE